MAKKAIARKVEKPKSPSLPDGTPDLDRVKLKGDEGRRVLCSIYRVTEATVSRWKRDGVDMHDPQAVKKHISSLLVKPPAYRASALDPQSYDQARTRKMALQCIQLERQIDREDGDWTHNDVIREDTLAASGVLKAGMLKLEAELPPVLAGLNEADMQKEMRPRLDSLLREFVERLGKITKEESGG